MDRGWLRSLLRRQMAVGATVVLSSQHQTGRRRTAVCTDAAALSILPVSALVAGPNILASGE